MQVFGRRVSHRHPALRLIPRTLHTPGNRRRVQRALPEGGVARRKRVCTQAVASRNFFDQPQTHCVVRSFSVHGRLQGSAVQPMPAVHAETTT